MTEVTQEEEQGEVGSLGKLSCPSLSHPTSALIVSHGEYTFLRAGLSACLSL